MIKKVSLNLSLLTKNHRLALWILLILLTAIILLSSVHLSYEYHAVQSLYIFDNLPLFGALYFIWMALLLLLLFSPGSEWEKLAIVCIFALVYLGFWTIAFSGIRGGPEAYSFARSIGYIGEANRLPSGPGIIYSQFPGFILLGSSIQQITGIDIIPSLEKWISLFFFLFSAVVSYLLFRSILGDNRLGAFAALLFILVNSVVARTYPFQARYFGWCLLILSIALIFSHERGFSLLRAWQGKLILILVFGTLVITHAPSSFFLIFVLLALYLVYKIVVSRLFAKYGDRCAVKVEEISLPMIVLVLVVFMAWEIYYAKGLFEATAIFLPLSVGEWLDRIGRVISTFAGQSGRHIGQSIPLWANAIQIFWWALSIGLGAILALRGLVRIGRLTLIERKVVGGFIAAILVTAVIALIHAGGSEYYRLFYFLPIFSIPLIGRFFHQKKRLYVFLVVCFLILSLPTFLVHNKEVPNDIIFPQDISAAQFLGSTYDTKGSPVISSNYVRPDMHMFYAPDADFGTLYGTYTSELVDRLITELESSKDGQDTIFIFCKTISVVRSHRLLVSQPTPAKWKELDEQLEQKNKIYDNGLIRIYRY